MNKSLLLKYIGGVALISTAMSLGSCTDEFQDLNTTPGIYKEAKVDNLFVMALNETMYTKNYYWSVANGQREGLEYTSSSNGAGRSANVGASVYGGIYTAISYGEQIRSQIKGDENKARIAISYMPQIYNALRATLKYGDIPYSEAGKGRLGGSLYPKYDKSQDLLLNLDSQLKMVVEDIIAVKDKSNMGFAAWADYIYKGDVSKWAKFANVLRLKIALTLANVGDQVNVQKAKDICADVAASKAGIFTGANDEYRFEVGKALDNPTDLPFLGGGEISGAPSKVLVDFFLKNNDPRLSMFVVPSPLTDLGVAELQKKLNDPEVKDNIKANIKALLARINVADNAVPVLTKGIAKWRFIGTNPFVDADKSGADAILYKTFQFPNYDGNYPSGGDGRYVFASVNARLHNPNLDQNEFFEEQNKEELNGQYVQPILPYSYMCFMLAQLDYLGIWSNPQGNTYSQWYYKGVEASIRMYDYIACKHRANPYKWNRTDEELSNAIAAYIASPDVQLNGVNDWEKINVQQYFNCFHLTDWAVDQVRMTGIPAENSTFYPWAPREEFVNRRSALDRPSNETAEKNWLDAQNHQRFSPGVSSIRILHAERMWWDMKSPDYGKGDINKTKK